jgi:outer membrane protein assembly factor BamB
MVTDEGQAWCIETKTGNRLWSQRLGRHHRPSPVYADGHLYFLADDGEMFVLKASSKFELVAKNRLEEDCFATPAISRGQIFIRSVSNLYCIGKPDDASGK